MSEPTGANGYVRVTSLRRTGPKPDFGESVVRVDRSNPALGNRHVLRDKDDPAERLSVIAAYRRDLEQDMARRGRMFRALADLAKRVAAGETICLACWCAPLPCHGDIIAEKVRELVKALEHAEKGLPEIDAKKLRVRTPYRVGKTPEPVRWSQNDIRQKRP